MFLEWFFVCNFIVFASTFKKLVNGRGNIRYENHCFNCLSRKANRSTKLVSTNRSDIVWPSNDRIDYNLYIYENNIPMGLNKWRNKLFLTIPRRRNGVVSTLNYIDLRTSRKLNQPLIPYPSLKANTIGFERSLSLVDMPIVSVYRSHIDQCNRFWMIDTGTVETLGSLKSIQPITIVIIDLLKDKIIDRYAIEESSLRPNSVPASLTVDIVGDCENAFAYIPDLATFGLIVFDLKNRNSWRFNHNYFYPDPLKGDLEIGNLEFQWDDGIFSVALSRPDPNFDRFAYFHPMISDNEFRVSTRILRNRTAAAASTQLIRGPDGFQLLGSKGDRKQTTISAFHLESNILFYAHINRDAIGCWNADTRFNAANHAIVYENHAKMIYPSDLIIDHNNSSLWVLSNNMPIALYARLDYDQINFRVWRNDIHGLVDGTICNNLSKL